MGSTQVTAAYATHLNHIEPGKDYSCWDTVAIDCLVPRQCLGSIGLAPKG